MLNITLLDSVFGVFILPTLISSFPKAEDNDINWLAFTVHIPCQALISMYFPQIYLNVVLTQVYTKCLLSVNQLIKQTFLV